jgi:hypothetical protein
MNMVQFTPVEENIVPVQTGFAKRVVTAFLESNMETAKVTADEGEHFPEKPSNAASIINKYLKKNEVAAVAFVHKGTLYLKLKA